MRQRIGVLCSAFRTFVLPHRYLPGVSCIVWIEFMNRLDEHTSFLAFSQ